MSKKEPLEVIEQIELTKLHPFPDHPFGVRDDDSIVLCIVAFLSECDFFVRLTFL